jgi:hypothetical protein
MDNKTGKDVRMTTSNSKKNDGPNEEELSEMKHKNPC